MTNIIKASEAAAKLIDGKAAATRVDAAASQGAKALTPLLGRAPCLAVVLVGEDPASQVYVRNKVRRTEAAGMRSIEHRLTPDASQQAVIDLVKDLNADDSIDGILVQLPLPKGLDETAVVQAIDPEKDVDGLTAISAGALVLNAPGLRPCTPSGSVFLAKQAVGELTGKSVVVIGRSILVGKPAALLFLQENCTVTLAHSRTADLAAVCRQADIIIAAAGRPLLVKGDWIKPGATVIDVGINRIEGDNGKSRLVGDVDFSEAIKTSGFITPVPGGVGPMTIAMLLANTVAAAARRKNIEIPQIVQSVLPG